MRPCASPSIVLALLVLLGPGATFAADDGAESRLRYARETLLAQARNAVGSEAVDPNLEPLRDALGRVEEALRAERVRSATLPPDERAAWAELETLVARQRLVLGAEAAPGGPSATSPSGALAQARWMHRWLRGLEPCEIAVRVRPTDAPATYRYEPGAPTPSQVTPADGPAMAPDAPSSEPTEPWAAFVRLVIEQQRSLVGKTLTTAPKANLSALFEAARGEASPGGVAVVQVDEVSFELNDPLLRLLAAQSKERFEAYSAEAPSRGLVDESTVREKTRRASERRAEADAFARRRGEAIASLDAMALRAYQLRREASDLAGAIDEAQRADAGPAAPGVPPAMGDETPPPPPPPSPTPAAPPAAVPMSPRLRVLEAREALATLQMRLLYWAALRTEVRIRLLEEAGKLARTDAVAAELALARFADELRRVRGERQLDRLEYEAGLLRSALEAAERGASAPGADRSGLPAARADVQRALLALNAVVSEGVRLRREVDRAEPAKEARPAAPAPGLSTSEELVLYRNPAASALDVAYARGALEHVGRFDAGLVAVNHAAVVRRIDALRARQRAVAPREDVRRRYDLALAEAEGAIERFAALAPLRTQWMAKQFRRDLEQYRTDFDDVRKGLDAERTRLEEQLVALKGLRDALLSQGVRSFEVRVDPDVSPEAVGAALEGATRTLDGALRWLTFRGETHAGQFLSGHAAALAGLAVAALLLGVGVRRLRRGIDSRLARAALRNPRLEVLGASVAREQEVAASVRAQDAAAVKATEEALLREVSVEAVTGVGAAVPDPPPSGSAPEGGS